MTYASVTQTTKRKNTWKNVYTVLNNNITGVGTRVYASYPLTNIQLPLIVIENVQTESEAALGDNMASNEATVIVNVYSKNAEKLDTLLDEIEATLQAAVSTFKTYGLHLPKDGIVDNETSGPVSDIAGNRVQGKSISVTFII